MQIEINNTQTNNDKLTQKILNFIIKSLDDMPLVVNRRLVFDDDKWKMLSPMEHTSKNLVVQYELISYSKCNNFLANGINEFVEGCIGTIIRTDEVIIDIVDVQIDIDTCNDKVIFSINALILDGNL